MPYPAKIEAGQVLRAAGDLLEAKGLEAVSMRAIAGLLDVVPNALYRYFPSRDALLAALADDGLEALLIDLTAANARTQMSPTLHQVAQGYLDFARRRPRLYRLMMTSQPDPPGKVPAHTKLWSFVNELLSRHVGVEDAPKAAMALWSYLHGVVSLQAEGLLGDSKPDAATFGLRALIAGFQGADRADVPHR